MILWNFEDKNKFLSDMAILGIYVRLRFIACFGIRPEFTERHDVEQPSGKTFEPQKKTALLSMSHPGCLIGILIMVLELQ